MNKKHALVIGGTGMLKDVSLWLAEQGYITSVVGRSENKHLDLKKQAEYPEVIRSIMVDYNYHAALEEAIKDTIEQDGPISLVVSWIPSYPALELVDKIISQHSNTWKLYQVKGSRRYFQDDPLNLSSNCEHHKVYLGFVLEENHSRWLTHNEIAKGVIRSIENDSKRSIVGQLHPYEKRPQ